MHGIQQQQQVNVLTRRPKEWAQAIAVSTQGSSWEHKGDFTGPLHRVSDDPAEVVPGSEYVIVAAPANAHPDLLAKVAPHLDYGAKVGALFAQGGFDWAVKQAFGPERCVRWRAQQAFFCVMNLCMRARLFQPS